jgi:putative ATP-binding cassette transporter
MKILSFGVAAFGLFALAMGLRSEDMWEVGLGVSALLCAGTTYLSTAISSYLRIFVAIFSVETIVFGLLVAINKAGLWPAAYADYTLPNPLPITVAMFSILTYALAHVNVVRQITGIADLYYQATERGTARIWPLPAYTALERRIATSCRSASRSSSTSSTATGSTPSRTTTRQPSGNCCCSYSRHGPSPM